MPDPGRLSSRMVEFLWMATRNGSRDSAKRSGDRGQPCLTPRVTGKEASTLAVSFSGVHGARLVVI